ncbi:uncharacterized protein LOC126776770 [Nymphalis io]|uniref:uncharacterized protein LOC126776770 n=1 Tax=Inachis io TaxID=171585 RepID=UPI00216A5B7D|nr:uncharacterized protein LOC126776770 [Nymphalis io]
MSKRFIYPQQHGERKKAKLDITVSDHNFPLSQIAGPSKDNEPTNTWGDDNDDEILLLASQACEEAFTEPNNTTLPDYSMCMQPSTTSTQISKPIPSTSKSTFSFKKPFSPMNAVSTKMRDGLKTISSPLPGMFKDCKRDSVNISEDIIINDHIYKGQNSDQVYRQLLQIQEENAKLKSENGKLLEKCFTKEGEASILRTQLKTCQIAVDNARLEKIKAQEKAQIEWSEKLTTVNNEMHELRNQLDFKNLEIISIKEKCKMLESNKVKLTQITVAGNDISSSQRHNNSMYGKKEAANFTRKVKTTSNSVQTEDKSYFLKLNVILRNEHSKLSQILPFILEPTKKQYSILDFNEKLQQRTDVQNKCRIFSTFHRLPTTPCIGKEIGKSEDTLSCIYEELSRLAANKYGNIEICLNILNITQSFIKNVQQELEMISRRMTTAFQKEMDERYIDATFKLFVIEKNDLLSGRALYKEEQGILARRMVCVLYYLLEDTRNKELLNKLLDQDKKNDSNEQTYSFIIDIARICSLLDNTTCALMYSGLLLSITLFLQAYATNHERNKQILHICKSIIVSRPMPFVTIEILKLLGKLAYEENFLLQICCKGSNGNLKLDYDQGVLLYKKDSCALQIVLKQTEVSLKCIEKHHIVVQTLEITRSLLRLYCILNSQSDSQLEQHRCDCQTVFIQVIVFALRICAEFLNVDKDTKLDSSQHEKETDIMSVCRNGVQLLQRCGALSAAEGPLQALCLRLTSALNTTTCQRDRDFCNMLLEITSTFQTYSEELPPSYQTKAWLKSFETFSIAD